MLHHQRQHPSVTPALQHPKSSTRDAPFSLGSSNPPSIVAHRGGVETIFPNPMASLGGPTTAASSSGGLSSSGPLLLSTSAGQLQQLSVLTAVICGLQQHHLLAVHEWDSSDDAPAGASMPFAIAVPHQVSVVEFVITRKTKEEQLCTFLLHADTNHAVVDSRRPGSTDTRAGGPGKGHYRCPSSASTNADSDDTHNSGGNVFLDNSAHLHSCERAPAGMAVSGSLQSSAPKVVFLYNISHASPALQDVLLDLLVHSIISVNATPRRVPQLRIVAFCGSAQLPLLCLSMRAAFLVSTFLSSSALRAAVAIDNTGGATPYHIVVPYRNFLELCVSSFSHLQHDDAGRAGQHSGSRSGGGGRHTNRSGYHGATTAPQQPSSPAPQPLMLMTPSQLPVGLTSHSPFLDHHVHISPCVERYFRHLLGIVRGCMSPVATQGHTLLHKYDALVDVLRALAWLLHRSDVGGDDRRVEGSASRKRILLGPTDVQCLIPNMVTHHLQLYRREWAVFCGSSSGQTTGGQPPANDAATVAGMTGTAFSGGGGGVGGNVDSYVLQYRHNVQGGGAVWTSAIGLPLLLSGEWDAVAASRRLPRGGGSAVAVDIQPPLGGSRRNSNSLPIIGEGTRRPPQMNANSAENSVRGATSDDLFAMTATTRASSTAPSQSMGYGAPPFDDGSAACLPYVWCRHVLATTLREKSTPPPG